MANALKVAFIQDAMPFWGGAESVLQAAIEMFPSAALYTLIYNPSAFQDGPINQRKVHTSFINRLPGAHQHHRAFLPLMPAAVEKIDLRNYDVVISFSYATAHGIHHHPGQRHICYMYTPLRYAWQHHLGTSDELFSNSPAIRWIIRKYFRLFRSWDLHAAARVDDFVTVSRWMAGRLVDIYHRQPSVLYPPVDTETFQPASERQGYFLATSRLIKRKRLDIAVEAFSKLQLPLVIAGEGPEYSHLASMAGSNVHLIGWQPKKELARLMSQARAFVHTCGEEFGIAMIEAQAAGCPVITLDAGSGREVVQPGQTGFLYPCQTVESLSEAVRQFDREKDFSDPAIMRAQSLRFNPLIFKEGFYRLVNNL